MLIDRAIEIAKIAGSVILEIYDSGSVEKIFKDDDSPLTKADIVSNEIIIDKIRQISDLPILTEELCVAHEERRKWDDFWLIDPLDGTKDFLAKNGEFAINIALLRMRRPVLGIIYAPAGDDLYYAETGKGAFLLKDGKQIRLPRQRCNEFVAARSRFHDVSAIDKFLGLNSIYESKAIGSSLKFGKLAEGVVNIYPRFSGSKEWDIAAGHIIIKEADCEIVDLSTMSEPLYNKPDLRNNFFIAHSKDVRFSKLHFPRSY